MTTTVGLTRTLVTLDCRDWTATAADDHLGSSSTVREEEELRRKIDEVKEFTTLYLAHRDSCTVGTMMIDILEELVDDMSLSVAFEFHRSVKLGLICPCSSWDASHQYVLPCLHTALFVGVPVSSSQVRFSFDLNGEVVDAKCTLEECSQNSPRSPNLIEITRSLKL